MSAFVASQITHSDKWIRCWTVKPFYLQSLQRICSHTLSQLEKQLGHYSPFSHQLFSISLPFIRTLMSGSLCLDSVGKDGGSLLLFWEAPFFGFVSFIVFRSKGSSLILFFWFHPFGKPTLSSPPLHLTTLFGVWALLVINHLKIDSFWILELSCCCLSYNRRSNMCIHSCAPILF